jgi:hypothetical protein
LTNETSGMLSSQRFGRALAHQASTAARNGGKGCADACSRRTQHGGMVIETGNNTPAQRPGDDCAAGGGRKRGKKWNIVEQMSLMDAYAAVCFDAAEGAQQTADVFASKVETAFGSKSCKTHADIIRSKYVAFQGYVKRVAALELSGNPTEGGLFHCAAYLHYKKPLDQTFMYRIATEIEMHRRLGDSNTSRSTSTCYDAQPSRDCLRPTLVSWTPDHLLALPMKVPADPTWKKAPTALPLAGT